MLRPVLLEHTAAPSYRTTHTLPTGLGPSPAEGCLWSHTSREWPDSAVPPSMRGVPTTRPTVGGGPADGHLPGPGGPRAGTPARTVRLPAAAAGAIFPTLELSGVRDHTLLGSSGALVHLIYWTFRDTEPRGSAPTSHPLPPGAVCTPDTPSPPGRHRPLSQVNRTVWVDRHHSAPWPCHHRLISHQRL